MKSELHKTLLALAGAIALTLAAVSVRPGERASEVFSDQGEILFPRLQDVAAVKAIEVIEYSEEDATARPLKVEMRGGRFVLASHYDYPAQSGEALAKAAGSLLGMKKDIAVSDRVDDQARYGVIDPLDAKNTSLTGRGKRVTLRDGAGAVLADLILGPPLKDKPGFRYVRLPAGKRIYAVKTEADPSARFEDWAEPSLLRLAPDQLRVITVLNYSVAPNAGLTSRMERATLRREGSAWNVEGGGRPDDAVLQSLIGKLANLRITGVRPKPKEMAQQLRSKLGLELTMESILSLRQRGYHVTAEGRVLASEGETLVDASNGVTYALRFGEVITSQGEGKPELKDASRTMEANRFVWVMATFDEARAARYGGPGNGQAVADSQSARFSDWYYIISGEDFQKLRPSRARLVK